MQNVSGPGENTFPRVADNWDTATGQKGERGGRHLREVSSETLPTSKISRMGRGQWRRV